MIREVTNNVQGNGLWLRSEDEIAWNPHAVQEVTFSDELEAKSQENNHMPAQISLFLGYVLTAVLEADSDPA